MKILSKAAILLGWVATLAGMGLSFFVFLSVVMRYFLGTPFHFTEELVGLLFCAMSVLSFPIAEKQGLHIRLEMLTNRLHPGARRMADLFSLLVLICFSGLLFFHAASYMSFSFRIKARTDASDLLIYPWIAAILVGLLVLVVLAVARKRESSRGKPD